ncbi:esterase-like activity of phytase family protein [Novosphingobium sp. BL-52-GroH]|uniref:esterase-like activity of phytase family protein n=1 Tax=Novosphingobium sp. BL-52-GroH TaxID=3349877 RepID=UPI00384B1DCC
MVRRSIALLIVAPALLCSSWVHSPVPRRPDGDHPDLTITREALPAPAVMASFLGPFRMEGAWQFKSSNRRVFGYSSITVRGDGRPLAFNDGGAVLSFAFPGQPWRRPVAKWIRFRGEQKDKAGHDVESVAHDPKTGRYWVALEGSNHIVRLSPDLAETGRVAPAAMAGWGLNTGAEAMARLSDGRFVAIREIPSSLFETRLHEAVLFSGDPIEHPRAQRFRFDAPDNFSVVDMAVLPDGRALILMRRLLWPMPMRFAGKIVIADTAQIRPGATWHSAPLASLASVLPVDNFEAIAAVPQPDGRIVVWLMSDDNDMRVLQRTLLWKLSVDPTKLPRPE